MRRCLPPIIRVALALLVSVALVGCALPQPPAQLRIVNRSTLPIDQVVVIFPDERITFGPLPTGGASAYRVATHGVYGHAAYHVVVNGQVIDQPVGDWIGEQPLNGLSFTYELTVDPQAQPFQQVRVVVRQP